MRTVKALMAMAVFAGVIGWSSAAMAVAFDLDVSVGWQIAGATCSGGPNNCLGFAGNTGPAGTATRLNWDHATAGADSFLSIGALPDAGGFGTPPIGTRTGTITDNGVVVRSAQVTHENNVIDSSDNNLATIILNTQLVLRDGATVILDLPFNPLITFLETTNVAGDPTLVCTQTSNSLGSNCDDQFTFSDIPVFDIAFSYLGQDYLLHVTGLHNADGTLACEPGPGGGIQIACLTEEGLINDRFEHLSLENVTQGPVPAPAGLLLVGMGLAGIVALPLIRKRWSAFKGSSTMRRSGTRS